MSVVGCVYVEREMKSLQELLDRLEREEVEPREQLELLSKRIDEIRMAAQSGYL